MRIVYFGSGAFGVPTLEHLSSRHELALVVTQPDKPAGRGARLTPTPVAQWAAEHRPDVRVIKPARVGEAGVMAEIRGAQAEAWVVIAFGQKLPRALLEGVFAINLHASLLPRWRGAAPIHAAILAGDTETGNTVITLADRMDAGLVLGTSRRAIDPLVTTGELHDLLSGDGPGLVERVLSEHAAGRLRGAAQDESLVTIAQKLSKADGSPDFRQPADFLRRQIHALTPWPGVTAVLGTSPAVSLKLLRAAVVEGGHGGEPGRVVDPKAGVVSCGKGTLLRLLEVQPAGKRGMTWAEFARGRVVEPMTALSGVMEGA
jgi:methionyl-tRNA formyltransferase